MKDDTRNVQPAPVKNVEHRRIIDEKVLASGLRPITKITSKIVAEIDTVMKNQANQDNRALRMQVQIDALNSLSVQLSLMKDSFDETAKLIEESITERLPELERLKNFEESRKGSRAAEPQPVQRVPGVRATSPVPKFREREREAS